MSEPAAKFIAACMDSADFHREMQKFEEETGRPNLVYAAELSKRGDESAMNRLRRYFEERKEPSA